MLNLVDPAASSKIGIFVGSDIEATLPALSRLGSFSCCTPPARGMAVQAAAEKLHAGHEERHRRVGKPHYLKETGLGRLQLHANPKIDSMSWIFLWRSALIHHATPIIVDLG
jgi:hypothetical protein